MNGNTDSIVEKLVELCSGIPKTLPERPEIDLKIPHAPKRVHGLDEEGIQLAIRNALRYFEPKERRSALFIRTL